MDTEQRIRDLLQQLRSALQADGGDLEIIAIEGYKVTLRLVGACGCCPHAQITLKNGIERILREQISEEIVVERDM